MNQGDRDANDENGDLARQEDSSRLMIDRRFVERLYRLETTVRVNEALSKHTTFGIGGRVPLYVQPLERRALPEIVPLLKESGRECKILGIGSNVLPDDGPLSFIVLDTTGLIGYSQESEGFRVEAGYPLRQLSRLFYARGWSGLEFSAGIPGTVGGGVLMNAGAYGSQIGDLVLEVEAFDWDSECLRVYPQGECAFSYRSSRFSQSGELITRVLLKTPPGERAEIGDRMREFERQRINKQPLEQGSAGSIFKKPAADFHVGKVIEELGLKGRRYGGARVSSLHGGFIVNEGSATSADVRALIDLIRTRVHQAYGIELELEIRLWSH
ncbi:MAG TPA: UDP-N-acetylmuramate dehydrogenase [Thermotogota bacterium]|jgi:UDP-N-acetylmuramate dehydrogenase|nr:UDP-N-acetylmuramate dehydrogenase [Thermotogota bacterium]HPD34799.1 UDP-N-acetylmuramate dehydrogenase [Thermotogota bacterium]HPN27751.1 UDP-N-acetylmuramate dehydrogenase [Thermotogota bacterium]